MVKDESRNCLVFGMKNSKKQFREIVHHSSIVMENRSFLPVNGCVVSERSWKLINY